MAKKGKATGEKKGKAPGDKKRKGRRARGTGSIFFSDAAGKWIGRKVIGKDAKGKPKRVEVWGDTQAEVIRKLAAALPPGPETTVEQWAEKWRATLTVRPATRQSYSDGLDLHILPELGHLKISEVRSSHIEKLISNLLEENQFATMKKIIATARAMFMGAVRAELIPQNPVSVAKKPKAKGTKKTVTPFTVAELLSVIRTAPGEYTAGAVLATQAAIGCRIGEALALDVPDWDPEAKTLSITKTFDGEHGIGPPKTDNGFRTIEVPDVLVPVLTAAIGGRKSGPIFITLNKKRFIGQMVGRAWRKVQAKLKLPKRRGHILRHSVITHLFAANWSPADIAAYVGDAVETLIKVYLHPTGKSPVKVLNDLYGGGKVGNGEG